MTKQPKESGQKARRIALAAAALLPVMAAQPSEAAETRAETVTVVSTPAWQARAYQLPAWADHSTPLLLLEFGRQLGKSETLADWMVEQIAADFAAGRKNSLVTVLSNSKDNGREIAMKAAGAARRWAAAQAEVEEEFPDVDEWRRMKFDDMKFEIHVRMGDKLGRIIVLAANPRTARGFSGHLVLDEFAFHQDAAAIWEAAEPIISSRTDFLCRIASTHNGKRTLFYQMCRGGEYPVWSMTRRQAWRMGQGERDAWVDFYERWRALNAAAAEAWLAGLTEGQRIWILGFEQKEAKEGKAEDSLLPLLPSVQIVSPVRRCDVILIKGLKKATRGKLITPEQAEREATDRRAYRQNYENEPGDDGGALLGMDVIAQAEREFRWMIDEDAWSTETLMRIAALPMGAELYVGQDVGRTRDLSAVVVMQKAGPVRRMVAMLEMRGMDLASQRREMERLIATCGRRLRCVAIDFTGVGTGLCDELGARFNMILPVDFRRTVPLDPDLKISEGRRGDTMRITERMGIDLQRLFYSGHIEIIQSAQLRSDLNRPGKIVTATGVSVSAERTVDDHSDRFWALALAEHGLLNGAGTGWTAETLASVHIPHNPGSVLPGWKPAGGWPSAHPHDFAA